MASAHPGCQAPNASVGAGAGHGPVPATMEMRLQQLELLFQQQLEREAQERRSSLQALEERLARLERGGSAAAAASSTAECGVKPRYPALAEGEGATEGSRSSGSEEEDEESWCGFLGEDGKAYEIAKPSSEALQESYALEESMWDASIFAFTNVVGPWLSLNVVVLMVLNILTQSVFIYVVQKYMCDDPMSADFLESLMKFRASVAHSVNYADLTQGMSLASQVCAEDEKIPWAGTQLGLLGNIGPARNGGLYLCTLVSLIWLLTLIGEVDNSLRFGAAMTSLLKGRRTYLVLEKAEGDEGADVGSCRLQLVSIGQGRFCFILVLVVVPRLVIVLWLAVVGIHFLSVTTSMGDLLLNALALAFIVEIDNMIFAGFAPQRVKAIVRSVAPIAFPPERHRRRCRLRGLSTLPKVCLVLVVLMLVYHFYISPFYWRMNQAYEILCSGDRNFVYAVNAATKLVEMVPSFKDPSKDWYHQELAVLQVANLSIRAGPGFQPPQKVLDAMRNKMLTGVVHLGPQDLRERLTDLEFHSSGRTTFTQPLDLSALTPSVSLLFAVRELGISSVAEAAEDLSCADLAFSSNRQVMQLHLREVARGSNNCSEALPLCHWPNMTSLRAICPVTCGCRNLLDPPASFFAGTDFGCPTKCDTDAIVSFHSSSIAEPQAIANQALPCMDSAPSQFLEDPLRKYFKLGLAYLLSQTQTLLTVYAALNRGRAHLGITVEQSDALFRSLINGSLVETVSAGNWNLVPGLAHPRGLQGCQFWTSWEIKFILGVDFCDAKHFRSLRPYCPVSCDCREGSIQCPPRCSAQRVG
mmetsp:Transcript_27699/g.79557  ORF Transcript_27699/g.79557 Transcript_27699/m.79557 type:complete len:812 (+) Transcript_27699:47-2482(+)